MKAENYDSRVDTLTHIKRVNALLIDFATVLLHRAKVHDDSKLAEPEKSAFDEMTPKLKALTYGSPEYKESLAQLGVALKHHYANNSHHPEYHGKGIDGMNLLDIVEMWCDWKAAGERHADGSMEKSIEHNKTRFAMSNQLSSIFSNTINSF